MKSTSKYTMGIRITSFFLMLVFLFSPVIPFVTPNKAYALNPACEVPSLSSLLKVPVTDSASTSVCDKETVFGWDSLIQAVLKGVIQSLMGSLTTWVNSGFQGKPVFVQDLKVYLEDIKNVVATEFLSSLIGSDICTFFGDLSLNFQTRPGVVDQYRTQARCTLDDIGIDMQRFSEDFSEGGWYSYEQSLYNSNNAFGLYIETSNALAAAIQEEEDREKQRLNWASGFMSFKDANGNVTTPGAMISARLGEAVGSDLRQYELADEFDELFAALLNQLVSGLFQQLQ